MTIAAALAAAVGAGGPAGAAAAREGATGLEMLVVTGSRIQESELNVLNSTTVITAEEIEARADSDVIGLLRDAAGLHVVQPSGMGGVSRVFIRGGQQELAMVLVDGVRVNDPNDTRGATFDFSTLNVEDIERIEIVRGPQSAVYGSDALAGVINFITRRPPDELGGKLYGEVGGEGYARGAIEFGGPLGGVGGFSLRAARVDDGEPVESTTFSGDSVSGRLVFGGNGDWDLEAFGRYSDSDGTSFGEDSGGARLAVIRDTDERRSRDLNWGLQGGISLTGGWRANLLATRYDHDSSFLSPGIAPGVRDGVPANGAQSELGRTHLAAHVVYDAGTALRATVGADWHKEDGLSDGFLELFPGFRLPNAYAFDREVTGVFGEIRYRPTPVVTLQASLRRDDPDREHGETTGKLGAMLEFNGGRTALRANWGQGFKLPGYFSLSSPLVGNPDLRPETSESADLSVTHRFEGAPVQFTAGVFDNRYSDLIDFDPNLFRMVNKDEVRAAGLEMSADYQAAASLSLALQVTYTDVDVKGSDVPLRQLPEWRGGVSLHWAPVPHWLVEASWLHVGETFDSSVPTGDVTLDAHDRFDATATWTPMASLSVVMAVDNLFDADYEEAVGFPAVGRRARIGMRYRF
jgi:outer membrane cobalamin receptor